MTLAQEKRLLRELRRFEVERLAPEDIESEDLNWYLADYSRCVCCFVAPSPFLPFPLLSGSPPPSPFLLAPRAHCC